MKKLLQFTIIIFISTFKIYSQNYTSDKKNWKYFTLKKETNVSIIDHMPSPALCGTLAFASITIVKTEDGDIFRVLNLCNSETYTINKIIRIIPNSPPSFNAILPYKYYENSETKKNIPPLNYDKTVLKTTWGTIKE